MSQQLECRGGPMDGELVGQRGFFFSVTATVQVVRDGHVIRPGFSSGCYQLSRDRATYRWVPDTG